MSKAINKHRKRLERSEPLAPPSTEPRQTLALLPHEIAFAEWLTASPKQMSVAKQLGVMQDIIDNEPGKTRWTGVANKRYLSALKQRKEFQKLFGELQRDNLTKARAMAKAHAPEYVRADYDGLKLAIEHGDYKTIPTYTKPIIDRVWPKQAEEQHVTAIKIELTDRQLREIDEDEIIVEAEVISNDSV